MRVICDFKLIAYQSIFLDGGIFPTKDNRGILPPGLFTLCRTCFAERKRTKIKGLELDFEGEKQQVLLAASIPLTKENWIPLAEGEIQAMPSSGRGTSRTEFGVSARSSYAIANGRVLKVVKVN